MAEALRRPAPPTAPGGEPAPAILACRRLGVRAGGRTILRGVDLEVRRGEVLAVIGPSGAGKSTLLKCLNRLVDLEPELAVSGEVTFHGAPIHRRGIDGDALRARIGMIFQQPVVFPRSIFANAIFGVRHLRRLPRAAWPERVEEVLRRVHLWPEVRDRLDAPATTLSVGQQQRLCLARALALEPEVILMDEPTSALDPKASAAIEGLIAELAAEPAGRTGGGRTVVLVTHDVGQARRLGDRVACLCVRDGAGELGGVAADPDELDDLGCRREVAHLEAEREEERR